MKILKQILIYLIWLIIAILIGIGYMHILLGPNKIPSEGLWYVLHVLFDFGLICIGLGIGGVIAVLFILLDIVYLKKKLKNNVKATLTRFMFLLGIAVVVGGVYYILEKVIDVI